MKKSLLLLLNFLFITTWTTAQVTITGLITDASGETLIGVNVIETGTTNGTVTDLDGKYTLKVDDANGSLTFRYLGMQEQIIDIDGRNTVDVEMRNDSQLLDEVIVTALGFKEKKDEMGASSTAVNADAVARSGESGVINGLSAKASNVRIIRSNGDPGAGSSIRIRGANTITGNGSPLIVVDGVPMDNSTDYGGGNNITGGRAGGVSQQSRLNDINPNDIASMQVLKGASAAALWGSRAANGVLVITTKNGALGKPKISYKATASFDQVTERIPMQTTWGQGRDGVYSPTQAEAWGDYIPNRSGGADAVDESGSFFTADDGTVYFPIDQKNSTETFADSNWDNVFQTGGFLQHDLSISGGSDQFTYYFGLGRLDQEGIVKNSNYERTNVRFNNKTFLTDWLTLSTKSSYTLTGSNRIQQNSNVSGLMLGLLRTPPDFDISDYKGTYTDSPGIFFEQRHRSYRRYLGNATNPTYNNPLWTVNEQSATTTVNRYVINPQLDITPTNWLRFILRGSADISDDKRVYFFPIGSGGDRSTGVFAEDIIGRKTINFDAITKANFDLTNNIGLAATLGWSINDRRYRRNSGQITGFLANARKETTSLSTAAASSQFENFKTNRRSNRGYGVLSFDLFDQVFWNVSANLEASSTVKGQFFYPATDIAWKFAENLGPLSFGKLRAAWGKVGVEPLPHLFETLAESGFIYSTYSDPLDIALFGGSFRIDDDLGNPDIKPEIKTEWEVGADMRFFKNKLGLGVTYYNNKIDDILISLALPASSGYDTQYGNFGNMKNNGIELDLNWEAYRTTKMQLNVTANFSRNRNEVTDLFGTETINLTPGASVSSRAIVGQPLGVLYGTSSQKDANGNFILDENGFPQLTTSPEVLGNPNPDWQLGGGFNFSWKGLTLNVVIEHSHGGEFSPRSLWVLRRFGTTQETANRFTLGQPLINYDGDEIATGTTVRGNIEDFGAGPVLLDETWYRHGIGGGFGDNQAYNFAIKDATFTKVRELSLSYRLDSDFFKQRLSGMTIGVSTRNWFYWDKIDGIDPEVSQTGVGNGQGLEYFTNPATKSFLITFGVDF